MAGRETSLTSNLCPSRGGIITRKVLQFLSWTLF